MMVSLHKSFSFLWSSSLIFLILLVHHVKAGMDFLKPDAHSKYTIENGEATVDLEWLDRGYPPDDLLTEVELRFCHGTNDEFECDAFTKLTKDQYKSGKYSAKIESTAGSDGDYFFQMNLNWGADSYRQYSNRFGMDGMTGPKKGGFVSDTESPQEEANINREDYTTMADFKMSYMSQTGKARFAPMQSQPGTKVTATTWTRRYPTSSLSSYFKSPLPTKIQLTTVTPGWDYKPTTYVNYAPPAPQPSANGGWYEPSQRLTMTPRKMNVA